MSYLQETVTENHLKQHIALGVKVISADWNHDSRSWNLALSITEENGAKNERRLRCSMLYMCSGYFSYDTPHDPKFPGFDKFKGLTLHPQFWPDPCPPLQGKQVAAARQLAVHTWPFVSHTHAISWGKCDLIHAQVVVIGSGATAMTIVPALANDAVNVTMLQRSPTYIS